MADGHHYHIWEWYIWRCQHGDERMACTSNIIYMRVKVKHMPELRLCHVSLAWGPPMVQMSMNLAEIEPFTFTLIS